MGRSTRRDHIAAGEVGISQVHLGDVCHVAMAAVCRECPGGSHRGIGSITLTSHMQSFAFRPSRRKVLGWAESESQEIELMPNSLRETAA